MSHTVTGKLNKAARQHPNQNGVTFFVSIGEKNYNFQTKENEWTNYDAALFAKDAQIQFYNDSLVEGAIVSITGTGLIMEVQTDAQYKPKLMLQDAKMVFISSGPLSVTGQPQGGFKPQAPQQPKLPQQAPAKVPTPDDMSWVKAIEAGNAKLEDINDPIYRKYIEGLCGPAF